MYNTKIKGYQSPEIDILSFQGIDAIMNSVVDAYSSSWSENPWSSNGGEH